MKIIKTSKGIQEFIDFLKKEGYNSSDIMFMASVATLGDKLAIAYEEFGALYDSNKIDGFPPSAIEVLEKIYGKSLKKKSKKWMIKKVTYMQRMIIETINDDLKEYIEESVDNYLNIKK